MDATPPRRPPAGGGGLPPPSPFASAAALPPAIGASPARRPLFPDRSAPSPSASGRAPSMTYADRHIPSRSASLRPGASGLDAAMALAEGPGGLGGVTGATATAAAPASPPPPPQAFATPATPGGGAMTGATMPATPPRSASGVGASTTGTVGGGGGGGDGGDGGGAGAAYAALLRTELLGAPPAPLLPPPPSIPGSPARALLPPPSPAAGRRVLAYADDTLAGRRPGGGASAAAAAAAAAALFSPGARSPARPPRKVARTPFKVLDAPALADDFYLNLVDWSSANVLAVGLGSTVYLWSAATAKVTKLVDLAGSTAGLDAANAAGPLPADPAGGDAVCSVAWSGRGTYLAVGTGSGAVQLWDVAAGARVRTLGGHRGRVGAMAWAGPTLATGSRDRTILQRDVRAPPGPSADDADAVTARLGAHRSEVCGLRWSPDGGRALASGGNDNLLHVWCPRRPDAPRLRLAHHTAAIKALAWSPHQHGLLASGGGTADRCIRVWNTTAAGDARGGGGGGGAGAAGGGSSMASAGAAAAAAAAAATTAAGWPAPPPPPPGDPGPPPLGVLDTGSQVCNLAWARHANELVSTHGYSQNQVALWRYGGPGGPGSLTRLATLTGHTLRVLYLAAAPDGQTVVTGAGDETLRFWSVFPGPRARGGGDGDGPVPLGAMSRANIR